MGRQNKSRRWMAEQIGAPHNTVARWIAGDSNPGADNLDAMCRALGFTLADLIVAVQCTDPRFRGHGRRTSDRILTSAHAA